jgi:hypothetical protein
MQQRFPSRALHQNIRRQVYRSSLDTVAANPPGTPVFMISLNGADRLLR